ncbi:GNAT superfamily N-acetyltransferase [Sphingomonas sp. BE270]|uniref:GNAT family N-acetyltransferase n=1 Tax=unclassified Sphingomonas TaxID=196159 RepID=UPI00053E3D91|nr:MULTISPECIES: GNAT family N-acetyltransferase [unclassified Sphingomonas]MDR6847400.1 GNAT superfamily N-acetyltransferase [Sphingomonas sp. BE137]MDR7256944.1 GNAT superfamily N-acetyltransferase [Sphingomonas sp. BE270]
MANAPLSIRPIDSKADRKRFVDLPFRLYANDPNWVPPLKGEALGLITPAKNGWFSHAKAQLFLAERDGKVVGRISAHIDTLALEMDPGKGFGPGCGQFGLLDAEDGDIAKALIATAEGWLRDQGMTRVLGPISMSIWEEPGLLVEGFDHPPTIMMGHAKPEYRGWIEAAGYTQVKELLTYELDITKPFSPLLQRIIASGEKNPRIRIRNVDKTKFDEEAAIILTILNDAWSDNWGFVPLTPPEIKDVGVKLKPIVFNDLIRIAEVDGKPVAFMITLPDLNEAIMPLRGNLLPFGWAKLLLWLRRPRVKTMRVPLMGVLKELQSSRLASQLAFMMIEYIKQASVANYGATRGEIGWILEDNQGMRSIAEAIECTINKRYWIYGKTL